jgi:hypothetical protein
MCTSSPDIPPPPPPIQQAREAETRAISSKKKRQRATADAATANKNIYTTPGGLTRPAMTSGKTLFGQ